VVRIERGWRRGAGVFNAEARRFGEYAELHKSFSTRMALKAKAELAEEAEASPGIWFPRGLEDTSGMRIGKTYYASGGGGYRAYRLAHLAPIWIERLEGSRSRSVSRSRAASCFPD
jgi:hypothetical protein